MLSLPYLRRGLEQPDRIAVVDANGAWTYAQLAEYTATVAAQLTRGRLSLAGERVGLFLEPTRESIAALLGTFEAGGVALPFSVHVAPREIAYQVSDGGVERIVCAEAHRARIEEAASWGSTATIVPLPSLLAGEGVPRPAVAVSAPAMMLYTSGTTGQPKGVLHAHESLINQADVLYRAWGWSSDDTLYHTLPLHHVHGLINGVLGALWAGATLRFAPRFEVGQVWQAFVRREATVYYAVPTIYHQLVQAWERQDDATRADWAMAAGDLRLAVSGSAALPAPLWQRWHEITGQALLERYGMTEIGMALSNPYAGERRAGTVGQPLPDMKIRLVDETGVDVPAGEAGEIWVRSKSLFSEYWRRPEATAESFVDGFYRTGDIAQVEDGYYRILGRASSDIIKSAGYKLSALEIEEVLLGHPAVREVAVVGAPSFEWGEIVTAFIVPAEGAPPTLEELRTYCADKLSPYKQPRRLELLEEMPRNAMGKTVKGALRDRLAAEAP